MYLAYLFRSSIFYVLKVGRVFTMTGVGGHEMFYRKLQLYTHELFNYEPVS